MLSCFHFLFGSPDNNPAYLPPANCAYHDPPPGTAADYSDNPSVFGKILRGELPSRDYREDEELLAFNDRTPKARLHALVIPKRYVKSVYDLTPDDVGMLRGMRQMGLELMEEHEPEALANDDYTLCFHIPPFYSVDHLHMHVNGVYQSSGQISARYEVVHWRNGGDRAAERRARSGALQKAVLEEYASNRVERWFLVSAQVVRREGVGQFCGAG